MFIYPPASSNIDNAYVDFSEILIVTLHNVFTTQLTNIFQCGVLSSGAL
jgi:hypothetical protein